MTIVRREKNINDKAFNDANEVDILIIEKPRLSLLKRSSSKLSNEQRNQISINHHTIIDTEEEKQAQILSLREKVILKQTFVTIKQKIKKNKLDNQDTTLIIKGLKKIIINTNFEFEGIIWKAQ